MNTPTKDTAFHIPEGMAYTCHNEGVCCNVFETIPVDKPAAQALVTLDHAALNTTADNPPNTSIIISDKPSPSPSYAHKRIARKPCGACVMLTPDNLCAIHAHAGLAAKPRPCQDFPYRYVNTPGGVYVGLSFVCPSVRANRGKLLTEQTFELIDHYHRAGSIRDIPQTISLNARVNLTWPEYLEIESTLIEILNIENEPLPNRLIALCLIPTIIDQMLIQTNTGAKGRGASEENLVAIISTLRANNYAHILRLARKQTPPNPRNRRMFLGMYAGFANTLHRRQNQGRIATVAGVMNQYIRHAVGRGAVTLKPIDAQLTRSQLDNAPLPESGSAADQITRYITHCIFRKDLTLTGDLTRRVRLLALNAALIPWYAVAQASAENRESPTESDYDQAIGHIEKLYGFHSTFHQFFEKNKTFADITDSFILKPAYPYTLFR